MLMLIQAPSLFPLCTTVDDILVKTTDIRHYDVEICHFLLQYFIHAFHLPVSITNPTERVVLLLEVKVNIGYVTLSLNI